MALYLKPKKYKKFDEHKVFLPEVRMETIEAAGWFMCFEPGHSAFCWHRTIKVER